MSSRPRRSRARRLPISRSTCNRAYRCRSHSRRKSALAEEERTPHVPFAGIIPALTRLLLVVPYMVPSDIIYLDIGSVGLVELELIFVTASRESDPEAGI